MSGITFGSVGDIIAVGQIALALARALTESRGSAKEYRQLVKDLESFDQALLQVIALWQNYEDSPELIELGKSTKDSIQGWRDVLLAFRLKVDKKYGTSMLPGGSGNWMKDVSKKVLWLKEKDDIVDLRRRLQLASDALLMLTMAAMGEVSFFARLNKLSNTAQAVRVELVHGMLRDSLRYAEEQMTQLRVLEEKIDSQTNTCEKILTNVRSTVASLAQVRLIAIDMKCLLGLLHNHIVSIQATPRGLGTHWQQAPVTLEDALGFVIPIPLELVNTWEMFDMIISKRFEKHVGHTKIQRREYAIEEGSTGREVNRASDWYSSFHPGQKVEMSVLFSDVDDNGNYCPRCRTKSAASTEIKVQCKMCQMWFQRLVEIEFDDMAILGESGELQSDTTQTTAGKTRMTIRPGDFQRVKLLRKLFKSDSHTMYTGNDKGGARLASKAITNWRLTQNSFKYMNDVAGQYQEEKDVGERPTIPLTADNLQRLQNLQDGYGQSIGNRARRLKKYSVKAAASSRTSSSSGDSDNGNIKVTGQTRILVGGIEIRCADGGEISIQRQKSLRNGGDRSKSKYGGGRIEDRQIHVCRPSGRVRMYSPDQL
ncbi:hypothetical protein DL98DRAFT_589416 [Cadophora sp. DSE1049]|nr:hypothetical protein DL98DRAFT_589416 [Cadophora sp. DSE1049]